MSRVSVVIPTFNRADMLVDAIDSVLHQTYADWELIVVDDGSSDGIQEVVARFADSRLRYIRQSNQGVSSARNTGIRAAQGVYVALLDSDDTYLPHKLEWQVAALDASPQTGLIAAGHLETDATLGPTHEVTPWLFHPELSTVHLLEECPFIVPSVLIRRAWLETVGLFDADMHFMEDWDLWLRLAYAGCRMCWMEKIVCCYRLHGNNTVHNLNRVQVGLTRILDKFYAQPDVPGEAREIRGSVYAKVYLSAAVRAFSIRECQAGRENLQRAIQFDDQLLAGDPPKLLDTLASSAQSTFVNDGQAYMRLVVENLPEVPGLRRFSTQEAIGIFKGVTAFDRYRRRNYSAAFVNGVGALRSYAGWWRQRGLLSITFRSLLAVVGSRLKPGQVMDEDASPGWKDRQLP